MIQEETTNYQKRLCWSDQFLLNQNYHGSARTSILSDRLESHSSAFFPSRCTTDKTSFTLTSCCTLMERNKTKQKKQPKFRTLKKNYWIYFELFVNSTQRRHLVITCNRHITVDHVFVAAERKSYFYRFYGSFLYLHYYQVYKHS